MIVTNGQPLLQPEEGQEGVHLLYIYTYSEPVPKVGKILKHPSKC